jgi:multiple sugar transport system permease protein
MTALMTDVASTHPAQGSIESSRGFSRLRRASFREAFTAYLFLLPGFIPFVVFAVMPIIGGFSLSLVEWNLLQPWAFVGLQNFRTLFTDGQFWNAMRVSGLFTLGVVPTGLVIALLLAVLLNGNRRGLIVYRTLYFLPVVTATVAISMVWRWLLAGDLGLVNTLLSYVGIDGPDWLGSRRWALPAVIVTSVWKGIGYSMVLFLAGLQNIPQDYYDAAKIDGASAWRRFRDVTLPLLSPTTFFVVVVSIISSLQVFDQVFVMTDGGPYRSTVTASYFIYESGFQLLNMGYASAAACVLFVVIFIASVIQWRLQKKWVHYE